MTDEREKESVRLLDIFATHYVTCNQCKCAFSELRDTDYCETGNPLFQAWREHSIFEVENESRNTRK
jgi:hypothetical protein